MGVKFDINCAYNKYPLKSKDQTDLKNILFRIQTDPNMTDTKIAAYLLATIFGESVYRPIYEAYWMFKGKKPYEVDSPKLVEYFRTKSKIIGPKYSNGLPIYLGRSYIQLSHDYNYKSYDRFAKGIFENPELAMNKDNSYNIASSYFKTHKKGRIYSDIANNNLTQARKFVNGGTNHLEKINNEYYKWLEILTSCGATPVKTDKPFTPPLAEADPAETKALQEGKKSQPPQSYTKKETIISDNKEINKYFQFTSGSDITTTAEKKTSKTTKKVENIDEIELKQIIESEIIFIDKEFS